MLLHFPRRPLAPGPRTVETGGTMAFFMEFVGWKLAKAGEDPEKRAKAQDARLEDYAAMRTTECVPLMLF